MEDIRERSVDGHVVYALEWKHESCTPPRKTLVTQNHSQSTALRTLLLPEGFPESVTPDYLEFQVWDTLQALSSYLRGILCTKALLAGVGVGNQDSSAVAAAMQWALRDGTGMLGGVLFAWKFAAVFGADLKSWRLFADVINDVGLTLELAAPHFPQKWFLWVACSGSLCKSLCGVAAGASRSALMHHFSRGMSSRISDIAAKEGIQETCVTLIGLVLGLVLTHWHGESVLITWTVFVLLTIFHVYANYRAVRCLALNSLNLQRTWILAKNYCNQSGTTSPISVSSQEALWFWNPDVSLVIGASVCSISATKALIQEMLEMSQNCSWFIFANGSRKLFIFLKEEAQEIDVVMCMFQINYMLKSHCALRDSFKWIQQNRDKIFQDIIKQGWNTNDIYIQTGNHRLIHSKKT